MRSFFVGGLLIFVGIFAGLPGELTAASVTGSIIQVSRKLRMTSAETSPPKDYYIDLGEQHGIKVGDILTVSRVMAVVNENTGDSHSVLHIPLAEVKVFLVGENASVARLAAPVDAKDLPVLNYPSVMLGDEVELKTSLPFQQ